MACQERLGWKTIPLKTVENRGPPSRRTIKSNSISNYQFRVSCFHNLLIFISILNQKLQVHKFFFKFFLFKRTEVTMHIIIWSRRVFFFSEKLVFRNRVSKETVTIPLYNCFVYQKKKKTKSETWMAYFGSFIAVRDEILLFVCFFKQRNYFGTVYKHICIYRPYGSRYRCCYPHQRIRQRGTKYLFEYIMQ